MTRAEFRRLALSFPATTEREHMNHPGFRVAGKIFATLAYPDSQSAMIKLTPEQQAEFVHADPGVFTPIKGGWGRKGATNVKLRTAKIASVRRALTAAWWNTAPRHLARKFGANL
jgi:hypothetical protein